jgi:hypothetical protein
MQSCAYCRAHLPDRAQRCFSCGAAAMPGSTMHIAPTKQAPWRPPAQIFVCGIISLGLGALSYRLSLPQSGLYLLGSMLWLFTVMPFWLLNGALRRARDHGRHPVPAALGTVAVWFICFLAFCVLWADGKHDAEAALPDQPCASPNCVPAEFGSGLDQSRLTPSQSTSAVAT